jgi:hypothetical protein
MSKLDSTFNGQIFRKDMPLVIASNRSSAVLHPVRLRYQADGYAAGTVLARNTTDGLYQAYTDGAASGTGTAAAVLFEAHGAEDFPGATSNDSCLAVGIFGGCSLFYDSLTGIDAAGEADLGMREITDATGVKTVKF